MPQRPAVGLVSDGAATTGYSDQQTFVLPDLPDEDHVGSLNPLDWKIRNSEHVQHEILTHTVAGSIVLSHDIHKTTVDAMPATLDGLIAKGFKFVTVSELLKLQTPIPPPTPKPVAPIVTPPPSASASPSA